MPVGQLADLAVINKAADEKGWPPNTDGDFWRIALDNVMVTAGMETRKGVVKFAKGQARALFVAVAEKYQVEDADNIIAKAADEVVASRTKDATTV
jgi:hypothetical protein